MNDGEVEPVVSARSDRWRSSLLGRASGWTSMNKVGLTFRQGLPQHSWEEVGVHLRDISSSSAWWLADWLIFGEESYGSRYRAALDRTGLDYQTLRNYAWVARRFEHARRRETLSFAHHAEVAHLSVPEQDYWLRKAERENWSRNELRRQVRASIAQRRDSAGPARSVRADRQGDQTVPQDAGWEAVPGVAADGTAGERAVPGGNPNPGNGATIEIELQSEQLDRCSEAAVSCGLSLNDWVAQVLQAAVDTPITVASAMRNGARA